MKTKTKQMESKSFIQKHCVKIIITLALLLMVTNCSKCSYKRELTYSNVMNTTMIDSLKRELDTYQDSCVVMNSRLNACVAENELLKSQIVDLKNDKRTLNDITKANAKTIKNMTETNEKSISNNQ